MKADITNTSYALDGRKHRYEKPCHFYEVMAYDKDSETWTYGMGEEYRFDEPRRCVVLRIYTRSGRTCTTSTACLWVHGVCSGSGKYSGLGLHVPSEAAALAFKSAGIILSEDIAGRGLPCLSEACAALVRAMGASRVIVTTHQP